MSLDPTTESVSRETSEKLRLYAELLEKWNRKINLVSKHTIPDLWTRHFVDSAQIHSLASDFAHWLDIGSGGGFPGLVIAIRAAELQPDATFTLIESDQRKCAFLRSVARETGVKVQVLSQRIEQAPVQGADVLSARALASLSDLLGFAERHLAPEGVALFPKGQRWKEEISEAEAQWRFRWEAVPSKTESEAVILKIGGIRRVASA
ncbi:16S rRNA (guanine(527)-N(7))-methyltransferase RsmG [Pseudooceanicola sp. CBS1P-1]|uniref:Ribosomal RNA small subunit methyltransferase G n=1 Tax=Pseudooceanicola albus TaxID=2692189 RepID=A0A6L7FZ86_9RHOB|nr:MULTISPECIES: 16S rRNA (guanine(527)-N(7))-methyltransferase RsmG [Pseudooceanicola]MBT9385708.1 16S rRNA (guanine(527)-N(7))-methyltransferase RsmG [Pseudooceanicola endophyticus]MXN16742.1 16S rRNA (guanine(527)-N(7))-methyltransferase RsmG [Pseudooceanicola albus]